MKKLIYLLMLLPVLAVAQTTTENYVVKKVYKTKRTTVNGLSNVPSDSLTKVVSYFDGLGRIKQNVAVRAGANLQDIITHFQYDVLGRQVKDYLPYTVTTNNGDFRSGNIDSITKAYYKNKYPDDFLNTITANINPYSEKTLEASPLNRIFEQTAPGEDWAKTTTYLPNGYSGGHTIKFEYKTNTTADAVKNFSVSTVVINNTHIATLIDSGNYLNGTLSKSIIKDENWISTQTNIKDHTTEEFKNKSDQVVLKRTYNANITHDTYYVYDDFGNLTYVLPPKVNNATISQTILDDLCYQYKYDYRKRLVEKKIPGKEWEYIVYDNLDRPVLTQDSILRQTNHWLFTKYDALGRVVITGKTLDNNNRNSIQESIKSTFPSNKIDRSGSSTTIDNTAVFYNYTQSYPSSTSVNLYSINYYDTYTNVLPSGFTAPTTVYNQTITTNTKGLSTVSKVRVLDTSYWITTITYYDEKARPIYVYSKNDFLGTTDIVESKLDDLTGIVLETRTTHQKTGKADIVTIDIFTYDHADRLLKQRQCIGDSSLTSCYDASNSTNATFSTVLDLQNPQTHVDNNSITLLPGFHAIASSGQTASFSIAEGNAELLVSNTYDDLGQLKTKKVGNTDANPLQTIDYNYNVRGWLTNINNDNNADNDLFNFSLSYNNPNTGTALYNGNISQTSWNTLNTDTSTKTYTYAYDALNRITSAISSNTNYNLNLVTYDKNGNIERLTRMGHTNSGATTFGTMDDLHYYYNGNQLHSVTDNGNDTFGFKDGNTSDSVYSNGDGNDDFKYDVNGNMIKDANKGITNITYNHLNLPKVVTINGNTITYTYDAAGIKLRKVVSGTTTDYAGNYIYNNNNLQFFNHAEGYFNVTSTSGTISGDYIYQYRDHLGNIRLSYADTDSNGSITQLEIIEESNYYPFGLKHKGYNNAFVGGNAVAQKFKYNGQELNESFGLEVTEMDFRQYDIVLGRFMVIDPMSEKAASMTPYRFSFNNPVSFNDPSGLWEKIEGGYKTSNQDEIAAILYVLQNPEDSNPGGEPDKKFQDQKTIDVVFNYIERMEVENGELASVDGVLLSTVTLNFGDNISGRQLVRLRNEIAFYTNRTGYFYNQKDYEMRSKLLSSRSVIRRSILANESSGIFEPLTSRNAINYYGEQSLRLMIFSSYSDMMGSVSQGPVSVSRSVNARYLGRYTGNNSVRISPATNTSSTVSKQVSHGYFKNMSFSTFRAKYGHLFRGRFSGRGQYMKQMAFEWRKLKAGL